MPLLHLRRDECRARLADHAQHGDPVEQLAGDIAGAQHLLLRRFVQQGRDRGRLQQRADAPRPIGLGNAIGSPGRNTRAEDLEREAAAAHHHHPQRLGPALDRALDRAAKLMAAARGRQRRNVSAHEDRNDRNAHMRRHEMERHDDRMIDRELLRQRDVEARLDRGAPQVRGHVRTRPDRVDRHCARLVIGALERLRHPDREYRKIVQKERVEVIGVEHHDEVGLHRLELAGDGGEIARGLALRALTLHQCRVERRVRYAQCTDDLRHCRTPVPWKAPILAVVIPAKRGSCTSAAATLAYDGPAGPKKQGRGRRAHFTGHGRAERRCAPDRRRDGPGATPSGGGISSSQLGEFAPCRNVPEDRGSGHDGADSRDPTPN